LIRVDGKTNYKVQGLTVTDPLSHGIQVIRSKNTLIDNCIVKNCLLSGIRDFGETGTIITNNIVDNNGKDGQPYNGDGILLQSDKAIVRNNTITNNGNDVTFEHGIYAAHVATNYLIEGNKVYNNSASGIKASGGGLVKLNDVKGSVRGIVFADNVPLQVTVTNNKISATLYAILVTSNCNISRYKSDYNTFAKGSRFGYKGQSLTLAGWQKQTGLDKHSKELTT